MGTSQHIHGKLGCLFGEMYSVTKNNWKVTYLLLSSSPLNSDRGVIRVFFKKVCTQVCITAFWQCKANLAVFCISTIATLSSISLHQVLIIFIELTEWLAEGHECGWNCCSSSMFSNVYGRTQNSWGKSFVQNYLCWNGPLDII